MAAESKSRDIVVIGAGPAGLMAAIFAARRGLSVCVLDKSNKPLKKLRITGKGRCNLTNNCTDEEFFENVLRGERFLRSSVSRFGPADIMNFFTSLGVPLKTERGRRVFPRSDKAADIADALLKEADRLDIEIINRAAKAIVTENGEVTAVSVSGGSIPCKAAIIATGGLSYPVTGSDGDGYKMAEALGHSVKPQSPALVPLVCAESFCKDLQGLSLKNVTLCCKKGKKTVFEQQGEMLFTENGISGPLALSLSSKIAGMDFSSLSTYIDFKPALDEQTLDKRILRDFAASPNREFKNSLGELLPKSLIPVMVTLSGIAESKKVNAVTSAERRRFLELLKRFPLTVTAPGSWNEAVVTAGGVSTSEIDPKTMQSKKIKNLHFAGEVMDVDAYTGGYNLTIAFCTGFAAGSAVLQEEI